MRRIIRRKQVEKKTGYGRSKIYDLMSKGEFPKPVRLGSNAVGWVEAEIDAWIEKLIAERDAEAA